MEPQESFNTNTLAENAANNKNSGDYIIEREPIEGTPFHICGTTQKGYFLSMGVFRLSEPLATKNDVLHYIENNMWNIIGMMIPTVLDAINMAHQQQIKNEEPKN